MASYIFVGKVSQAKLMTSLPGGKVSCLEQVVVGEDSSLSPFLSTGRHVTARRKRNLKSESGLAPCTPLFKLLFWLKGSGNPTQTSLSKEEGKHIQGPTTNLVHRAGDKSYGKQVWKGSHS